jgi:hypothetical protein
MKVTPDFNEKTLAPGTYLAFIAACEQKTGKQSGAPYLNWKIDVSGQWVFHMTGLSGKGAQALKALIRAAKDPNYESGEVDTDTLIGCRINITVDYGINPDGSQSKYLKVLEIAPATDHSDDFDNSFGPA